jgi:hypothetical protein
MTRLDETTLGRLERPIPIATLPFVDTVDIEGCAAGSDEPSPCFPTATAVWYVVEPTRAGRLMIDLAGSTPLDPLVRIYRQERTGATSPTFVGCSSPVWNAQLSLEVPVGEDETLLAQVGTSESVAGRLVVRAELRE